MKVPRPNSQPIMHLLYLLIGVTFAGTMSLFAIEDFVLWGGSPSRNMVSNETNLPAYWDVESGKHIKWIAKLGSPTYSNPVLAGGKVFVGTNNKAPRNPKIKGDRGVVMAFRESDGEFLWQAVHKKLESGPVNDWPQQGICSCPFVEGERLYYVSNRCEIICSDTEGFHDNQNDGPYVSEANNSQLDEDIVWRYDMIDEVNVFPHNLAVCSPLVIGELLFAVTGNGVLFMTNRSRLFALAKGY